jgi:hypothetical protein
MRLRLRDSVLCFRGDADRQNVHQLRMLSTGVLPFENARHVAVPGIFHLAGDEESVFEPKVQGLEILRWSGHQGLRQMEAVIHCILFGHGPAANGTLTGSYRN